MNTMDLIDDARRSAANDNILYARAISLLQDILTELDGEDSVHRHTILKAERLLNDSYNQALKE